MFVCLFERFDMLYVLSGPTGLPTVAQLNKYDVYLIASTCWINKAGATADIQQHSRSQLSP